MLSATCSAKKNNLTVGKKIDFGYVFYEAHLFPVARITQLAQRCFDKG